MSRRAWTYAFLAVVVVAVVALAPVGSWGLLHVYENSHPEMIRGTPVCAGTGAGCREYISSSKYCTEWGGEMYCKNFDVKPY